MMNPRLSKGENCKQLFATVVRNIPWMQLL